MSEFEKGDEVVFRQVLGDGYYLEIDHPVIVENGTPYRQHHGRVIDPQPDEPEVVVTWDDGERTYTNEDRLDRPDDVEWYDND